MADLFKEFFYYINCMIKIAIAVINNPKFPGQTEKIEFLCSFASETEQLLNDFLGMISSLGLLELCQDQNQ